MKNTARPATDLPFPAITICASGLHMDSVEKKLGMNFAEWRTKNNRKENKKEAIERDIEEYMRTTFQIQSGRRPVNILDILDTMIAPNVDASIAANGIRENIFACRDSGQKTSNHSNDERKKRSTCVHSCANPDFKLSGTNCFMVSSEELNYTEATTECCKVGAQMATISSSADNTLVSDFISSRDGIGLFIGLNDQAVEGTFVWQDGSIPTYTNWRQVHPNQPDGGTTQNCVVMKPDEKWYDITCDIEMRFVYSMPAVNSCDTAASPGITGCPASTTTTTKTTTTTPPSSPSSPSPSPSPTTLLSFLLT